MQTMQAVLGLAVLAGLLATCMTGAVVGLLYRSGSTGVDLAGCGVTRPVGRRPRRPETEENA